MTDQSIKMMMIMIVIKRLIEGRKEQAAGFMDATAVLRLTLPCNMRSFFDVNYVHEGRKERSCWFWILLRD